MSLVGFTGISLEWLVINWARHLQSRQLTLQETEWAVYESQRFSPTAWRLVRNPAPDRHAVWQEKYGADENLVLLTGMLGRASSVWSEPSEFSLARWAAPTSQQRAANLAFGLGPGRCPAARFANELLAASIYRLSNEFVARVIAVPFLRPMVGSLAAPPAWPVRVTAIEKSAGIRE